MFKRKDRRSAIITLSEHGVKLARFVQADNDVSTVDCLTELQGADDRGIAEWMREVFPDRGTGFVPAYASFFPADRILAREAIHTRRIAEPGYLSGLLMEQAKVDSAREWHVGLIHPLDGTALTPESLQRSGILVGISWRSVREVQEQLRQWGLRPQRLEVGTLPLLGGILRQMALVSYSNAVAVCEVAPAQTRLYLIGKDGLHTPPPLPHGLLSIGEAVMKEVGAPDIQTALRHLESPSEALVGHSRRLIRMLSRHLRPAIDYFEMQTGQRIGSLFSAHLPSRLAWLEQALCSAVDLDPFPIDMGRWLPAVGLRYSNSGESLPGHQWLQTLSSVARFASSPDTPAVTTPPNPLESHAANP